MSGSSDYQEYLVYRRPPGFQFNFPADKKFVWVKPDPKKKKYAIAEVLDDSDPTVTVTRLVDNAEEKIVDKEDAQGLNPAKFDGVDDCATLGYLSEPAVLYNLKLRYDAKIIYTYSGLFCVVINPYRFFPIYTNEMVKLYTGKRREELAPHAFAVADESYRNLLNDRESQSMLVTGESGAGKTENTKKIIQYLASIAGRSGAEGKLEQQLLQCNPLLEALGNAKTTKNDNSSRFGKFIKITFGNNGFISGGSIVSYLLEKNRVVKQGRDERSFHIFYQICEALPPAEKSRLKLTTPDDFEFFNKSGCVRVPSVNDTKDFEAARTALKTLNFTDEEQTVLFSVVAAVMHLGNLKFKGDEQAEIANPAILDHVGTLLQIEAPALAQGLVRPRILAGKDLVAKSLNPAQASNSRDALAKALYGRMFLWVVDKINQSLQVVEKDNFIGILDIAGFEIFEYNSFEQLCINFTNERLQQFFNNHMFNLEQAEYKREKIEWTMINFGIDSQATIDLISKSGKGILSLLNEESLFPNGTDKSFTAKLIQTHGGKHPKFSYDKLAEGTTFEIHHYAGTVAYNTNQWLEKNKDPLQTDLENAVGASKNATLAKLFINFALNKPGQQTTAESRSDSSKMRGAITVTVGSQYKEQLDALLDTLGATHPHFIRCIIPNHKKVAGEIDDEIVLDQLACNGVLEGIRISRMGYPNRMLYPTFLKRYYVLADVPPTAPDAKAATKKILDKLTASGVVDPAKCQFGVTKIFFRVGEMAKVEEAREAFVAKIVPVIQALARGYVGRKVYAQKKQRVTAAALIQRNIRAWLEFNQWSWWKLFTKVRGNLKIYNYEQEIKKARDAVANLQSQIDNQKRDMEANRSKAADLNRQIDELKGKLKTEQDSYNALQRQFDDAEAERKKLDRRALDLADDLARKTQALSGLDQQRKDLEDDIAAHEKDEASISGEIDRLDKLKKQHDEKLGKLKAELEALQAENTNLKRNNNHLEEDYAESKGNLDGLKGMKESLERARKKLQQEIDEANEDLEYAVKDNKDVSGNVSKLTDEVKSLQRSLEDAQAGRSTADTSSTRLKSELDGLTADYENELKNKAAGEKSRKQLENETADAAAKLEANNKAKAELTKRLNKAKTDLQDMQDALEDESAEREQLELAKSKLDGQLNDLQRQLKEALEKLARLDKEKAGVQRQIDELNEKVNDLDKKNANLERANRKLQDDIEDLNDRIANEGQSNTKLTKAKAKFETDLKQIQRDLEDEKEGRSKAEGSNKKLLGEIDDLKEQVNNEGRNRQKEAKSAKEIQAKVADLEDALADARGSGEGSEKRLKKLESDLEELKEHLEDLTEQRSALDSSKSKLENELDSLTRRLDEESDARARVEASVKKLEADVADLRHQNEDLDSRNNALAKNLKKLTTDLEDLTGRNDAAQKDAQKADKNRKKLEQETKDLRQKAQEQQQALDGGDGAIRRTNDQLDDLRAQLDDHEAKAGALDRENKALQSRSDELEAANEEEQAARERLEKQLRNLEDELADFQDSVDASALEEVESIRRQLQGEVEDARREKDKEADARAKAENDVRNSAKDLEALRAELDDVAKNSANAERAAKKSQSDLDDINAKLDKANKSNKALEGKLKKAEADAKAAQANARQGG